MPWMAGSLTLVFHRKGLISLYRSESFGRILWLFLLIHSFTHLIRIKSQEQCPDPQRDTALELTWLPDLKEYFQYLVQKGYE